MKQLISVLVLALTINIFTALPAYTDEADDYCQTPANRITTTDISEVAAILANPPSTKIVGDKILLCFEPLIEHNPFDGFINTFTVSASNLIVHGLSIEGLLGVTSNPLLNITGSNVILRNVSVVDSIYTAIAIASGTSNVEIKDSTISCATGDSAIGISVSGASASISGNEIDGCAKGVVLGNTASSNTVGPHNIFSVTTRPIDISLVAANGHNYITLNDIEFTVPAADRVYTDGNTDLITMSLVISSDEGAVNIWKSEPNEGQIVSKIVGVMPSKGLVELIGSDGTIVKCSTIEIAAGVYDELELALGSYIYECNDLSIATSQYINLIFASDDAGQYSSGGFTVSDMHVVDLSSVPLPTTPGPEPLSPVPVQQGEQTTTGGQEGGMVVGGGELDGGGDGFGGMGAAKTCSLTTANMTGNATAGAILITILTALSPAFVLVAVRKRRR